MSSMSTKPSAVHGSVRGSSSDSLCWSVNTDRRWMRNSRFDSVSDLRDLSVSFLISAELSDFVLLDKQQKSQQVKIIL